MTTRLRQNVPWIAAWLALAFIGAVGLARTELAHLREAFELNQPLTAVLANTQAAVRLLKESPPEIGTAQTAMQCASEQARRASDVLTRLRRTVERPDTHAERVRVRLTVGLRVQTWAAPEAFMREFDRASIGAIVLDVRMLGISGLHRARHAGARRR